MYKGSLRDMSEYIGIDVSKNKIDVCWLRSPDTLKIKTRVFRNTHKGHEELDRWLLKHVKKPAQDLQVTLEPTGVYHEALMYFLNEQGVTIFLANPGKAKEFAKSLGLTHKTDKSDATMLARFGRSQPSTLRLWQPDREEIRELRAMLRRMDALESDLRRENNRREKTQCSEASPRVLASLDGMIEALESEIKHLKNDIDNHIDQYPDLKNNRRLLESITGIGEVMSRELVYLFAAKHFTNAREVAAYLGVIPKLNTSGNYKGRSTLTNNGPSKLRAKLYMASIVASEHNPDINAQRERLLKSGKTKMQALGAAMRKLSQICYGVVKNQCEYQPQIHR